MMVSLGPVEESGLKVQMEGLHPVSLNTITANGELTPRQAQAGLNIKIAALAIVACLTRTIRIGEIIIDLPLNLDQEVPLVVALQEYHLGADHDPAAEVVVEEEAGIKKDFLFTNS